MLSKRTYFTGGIKRKHPQNYFGGVSFTWDTEPYQSSELLFFALNGVFSFGNRGFLDGVTVHLVFSVQNPSDYPGKPDCDED